MFIVTFPIRVQLLHQNFQVNLANVEMLLFLCESAEHFLLKPFFCQVKARGFRLKLIYDYQQWDVEVIRNYLYQLVGH
jgi:hypothetical protein